MKFSISEGSNQELYRLLTKTIELKTNHIGKLQKEITCLQGSIESDEKLKGLIGRCIKAESGNV